MGIWIRSQDKEILAECNAVVVNPSPDLECCIYAYCDNDRVYLGHYSTKEKALKVLDEIASWIDGLEFARNVKSCRCNFIYQMPDDDEVK